MYFEGLNRTPIAKIGPKNLATSYRAFLDAILGRRLLMALVSEIRRSDTPICAFTDRPRITNQACGYNA